MNLSQYTVSPCKNAAKWLGYGDFQFPNREHRMIETCLNKAEMDLVNRHATELHKRFNDLMEINGLGDYVIVSFTIACKDASNANKSVRCCYLDEAPVMRCDKFGSCRLSCVKC